MKYVSGTEIRGLFFILLVKFCKIFLQVFVQMLVLVWAKESQNHWLYFFVKKAKITNLMKGTSALEPFKSSSSNSAETTIPLQVTETAKPL